MKKIIEQFERSYIINLRDRTDRKREVIHEFAKVGITLPHHKIEFYTAERPTEQGRFPTLGTRGNFTSHLAVHRLALCNNLKNVLIFEDDIEFHAADDSHIDALLSEFGQQDWDLVYFGYLVPSDHGLSQPFTRWSGPTIGGHFYAVNGHFLPRVIQYFEECERRFPGDPLGGPACRDGAYNTMREVYPDTKIFLAVPNLAHQRSSRTDIGPLKLYDRISWMRPVMRGLRRVKNRLRARQMESG